MASLLCQAQIQAPGTPISGYADYTTTAIQLPAVDRKALEQEDRSVDTLKALPYRFGKLFDLNLDFFEQATLVRSDEGQLIFQLRIDAQAALSLNVIFDQFFLPEGAQLYLYNPISHVGIGALGAHNNKEWGGLGVSPIPGTSLLMELNIAEADVAKARLHIAQVCHGYRSMLAPKMEKSIGESGGCNIDVHCEPGRPYYNLINSVALIIVNGNAICSGAMIATACADSIPYLLTANHCLGSSVHSWIFKFNWNKPSCNEMGEGPADQSISGAKVKASNIKSDFALLELSAMPPADYHVYFNGWDRSDMVSDTHVAIHHPGGDLKKLSIDYDSIAHDQDGFWRIHNWEVGTTEGGSSGSPLFNKEGRIIGQLQGGLAACGNDLYDRYGRLAVSWSAGETLHDQLAPWLDPCASGAVQIDGWYPNLDLEPLELVLHDLEGVKEQECTDSIVRPSVHISNTGATPIETVTYSITYNDETRPYTWNGYLAPFARVNLPSSAHGIIEGSSTFTASIQSVNGHDVRDQELVYSHALMRMNEHLILEYQTDFYPEENSLQIQDLNGNWTYAINNFHKADHRVLDTICMEEPGCFVLSIEDEYGDGVCCNYGDGYFLLKNEGGDTLGHVSRFQEAVDIEFCIDDSLLISGAWSVASDHYCVGEQLYVLTNHFGTEVDITWEVEGAKISEQSDQELVLDFNTIGPGYYRLIVNAPWFSDTIEESFMIDKVYVETGDARINELGLVDVSLNVHSMYEGYNYRWSDGSTEASLSNVEPGEVYSVVVTNSQGCEATHFIEVPYVTSNLKDAGGYSDWQFYPQPARDFVFLQGYHGRDWRILDALGRVVETPAKKTAEGWYVNTQALVPGTYLIQVESFGARPLVIYP